MKHIKKHQKRLMNLSVLVLLLLVLNINFTLTFDKFEFRDKEDIYEEISEDLSPELIVESPKNANYLYNLDFMPYGTYIYAPTYTQRFVDQSTLNTIYFKLYDANGGLFSQIRIFVDGNEQFVFYWNDDIIEFNIAPFLSTIGVHNIIVKALSDRSNKWVTHESILNVTSTSPCIAPFYDNFSHIQNSGNNFDWNIYTSISGNYNHSIYINNIEVDSGINNASGTPISFIFNSYGDFSTLDKINEIRLEINDTGEVTINQFNITNVVDDNFYFNFLDRNCYNIGSLTLMETEGFKIRTSAYSSNNDLERIVITANNLPVYTINNAEDNSDYEAPININSLINLMYENPNYDYSFIRNSLQFRAIVVNKYGQSSHYGNSPVQNIDLRFYDYYQLIKKTEDVSSGRNIETLVMKEEFNSDIEYSLTVVTDVLTPTTLAIAGSTGGPFSDNFGWEHCYGDNGNTEENNNCQIFGGFDKDQYWYQGGMVFWVGVENQSAVQFPMIVKIVYPEEIQPDELNNNWNLQFMHWIDNCETNERRWQIYSNETISENRDERLKDVGDNAIEVLIYSQGLYAFGMEPGDDYDNRDFFIPSFPIGLILFSIGIAITTISLKSKYKMKKK